MSLVNGLDSLVQLNHLYQRTRRSLRSHLAGSIDDPEAEFLATAALTHIEAARQGLKHSLRADTADTQELRHLVRDYDSIDCSESPDTRSDVNLTLADDEDFAASQHARLVLSLVPRLPDNLVSFPGIRSYTDIPVPCGPAALVDRLDEIERALWAAASKRRNIERSVYRRTYSFFETGSWHTEKVLRVIRWSA